MFADESGNFDFSRKKGASAYYILTTVTLAECSIGDELLRLRRELAFTSVGLDTEFHCSTEAQSIRDEVFALMASHHFRIDTTILEKAKAQPQTRVSDHRFYQYAWWLHFKYLAPRITRSRRQMLVVGASLGEKKRRSLFHQSVRDVVNQVTRDVSATVASWSARASPVFRLPTTAAGPFSGSGRVAISARTISSRTRSRASSSRGVTVPRSTTSGLNRARLTSSPRRVAEPRGSCRQPHFLQDLRLLDAPHGASVTLMYTVRLRHARSF